MRRLLPLLILFVPLTMVSAQAQDRGTLSVTATVVTSVAVVMDQNGNPRLVVANPADRNDNVSSISYVSRVTVESPKKSDSVKVQAAAKHKATVQ